jgi:tetratricopeptide (TPR) repeat protein
MQLKIFLFTLISGILLLSCKSGSESETVNNIPSISKTEEPIQKTNIPVAPPDTTKVKLVPAEDISHIKSPTIKNAPIHKPKNKIVVNELAQEQNDLSSLYMKALGALKANKFGDARNYLNKVIKLDSTFEEAYYNRALALTELGEYDLALTDYSKSIELGEKLADSYNHRGLTKVKLFDFHGAVIDYDKAITYDSSRAEIYFNRAVAKISNKDFQGALRDLQTAKIKETGNDIDSTTENYMEALALYDAAEIKVKENDFSQALNLYDKAINMAPDQAYFVYKRGLCKAKNEDKSGSVKDYKKSVQMNKKLAEAYYELGKVKLNEKDFDGAINEFDNALDANKDFIIAYQNRGIAKMEIQNYEAALLDLDVSKNAYVSDAESKKSLDVVTLYLRGKCYNKLGKYEDASSELSKSLELAPNYYNALYDAAYAKSKLNKIVESNKDLDSSITHNHNKVDCYELKGLNNNKSGDYEKAISYYTQAFVLDSTKINLIYARAEIKVKTGDLAGAEKDYNMGISKDLKYNATLPKGESKNNSSASISYNLIKRSVIKSKLNKGPEALADCNQAIKLTPTNADAYYQRGNINDQLEFPKAAIADYSKSIDLAPNNYKAYFNRALAYDNMLMYDKSAIDYKKTIALNDTLLQAYHNLGYLKQEQKIYQEAAEWYTKAISMPNKDEALKKNSYLERAICKHSLNDATGACDDAKKALELNAYNAQHYVNKYCK